MMLLRNHIKQLGRVNFTRPTALFHSNALKFNKNRTFCSFKSTDGKIDNEIEKTGEEEVLFMNYKEPKLNEFVKVLGTTGKNKEKFNFLQTVNCESFSNLGENILFWLEKSEKDEKNEFLSTLVNLNIKKNKFGREKLAYFILKFIVEPEEKEKRDFLEILEILEEIFFQNDSKVLKKLFSAKTSILIPYFRQINSEKQKLILEIFKKKLRESENQNTGVIRIFTESLLKDIEEEKFIELCEEIPDFKSKNFVKHFVPIVEKHENLAKLPAFQPVIKMNVTLEIN